MAARYEREHQTASSGSISPKGTDPSLHSQTVFDRVVGEFNGRLGEILDFWTPTEMFTDFTQEDPSRWPLEIKES
jgi:hypothetical protein